MFDLVDYYTTWFWVSLWNLVRLHYRTSVFVFNIAVFKHVTFLSNYWRNLKLKGKLFN